MLDGARIGCRITIGALLVLWLSGCAGTPKGDPFQPEIADDTKGVVYIFREPRAMGGRPVTVYVNQEPVGELSPGQYLARVVPPGECFVRAESSGSAVRQAELKPGDAVFFRVRAGRWGRQVSIDLPDVSEARSLIAGTVRVPD